MKQFIYIEIQEGGADDQYFTEKGLPDLYGWMNESVKSEDIQLVDFIKSAEIGEVFYHRLGWCIRLKDN